MVIRMRVIEVLITITNAVSIFNLLFLKLKKCFYVLPISSLILSLLSIIFEGYRIHMVLSYILILVLFSINIIDRYIGKYKAKQIIIKAGIPLLILIFIVSAALPMIFPVVKLPAPGGKFSVGTMNMSFIDRSRKEIFSNSEQNRIITVQVWYPSDNVKNKKTANFFLDKSYSQYLAESMYMPNLFDNLSLVKTHSHINSELSVKESKYPIILFSGGYLGFVGQNTILMEELASQGYIVFSISHPYEFFASELSDGQTVGFNKQQVNSLQEELVNIGNEYKGDTSSAEFEKFQIENAAISNESIHIWSDDTIFIADEVEKLNRGEIDSIFKNRLDTSNMGVFGHSFGGATAAQVCLEDSRFKAFINMDGAPFGDSAKNIIKQPFMIINGDDHEKLIKGGYSSKQENYIDVSIKGVKHLDFTDFTILLPFFKHFGILGDNGGIMQEEIVEDYVTSFFNKYLKGIEEPLIDEKLDKYDNVTVNYEE